MTSPTSRRENHGRRSLSSSWKHSNFWAGRFLFCLSLITLAAADRPPSGELPPDTLLLLVAPWCAPCWGELAQIDTLAKAALPLTLRVLAMEDGPRSRAMTADLPPHRQWIPSPADRAVVRRSIWANTPGLPFSVATDAKGRICARHGGGLTETRARSMITQCD